MFGGFDGEFYNDMHILHLKEAPKMRGFTSTSTINSDYAKLVDSLDHSNISFVLDPEMPNGCEQIVYANKSLVLFRLFEREVRSYSHETEIFHHKMEDVFKHQQMKS